MSGFIKLGKSFIQNAEKKDGVIDKSNSTPVKKSFNSVRNLTKRLFCHKKADGAVNASTVMGQRGSKVRISPPQSSIRTPSTPSSSKSLSGRTIGTKTYVKQSSSIRENELNKRFNALKDDMDGPAVAAFRKDYDLAKTGKAKQQVLQKKESELTERLNNLNSQSKSNLGSGAKKSSNTVLSETNLNQRFEKLGGHTNPVLAATTVDGKIKALGEMLNNRNVVRRSSSLPQKLKMASDLPEAPTHKPGSIKKSSSAPSNIGQSSLAKTNKNNKQKSSSFEESFTNYKKQLANAKSPTEKQAAFKNFKNQERQKLKDIDEKIGKFKQSTTDPSKLQRLEQLQLKNNQSKIKLNQNMIKAHSYLGVSLKRS